VRGDILADGFNNAQKARFFPSLRMTIQLQSLRRKERSSEWQHLFRVILLLMQKFVKKLFFSVTVFYELSALPENQA